MRTITYFATAAAAMLCSQPCLAAGDPAGSGGYEQRRGGFAGVNLKLPFGVREKASARLQLAPVYQDRDAMGGTLRSSIGPGLELGLRREGQLAYFVAGRDIAAERERLNMSGSTTTWIIIGGVVVLAIIVLNAVSDAQPKPGL